ncbi:MAG TPA: PEGA domain-containing protein [Candidatus Acidoferrales bacterium]|nr:PEGA domain-containing protein [Candidatus Acidoferrales bacterium]
MQPSRRNCLWASLALLVSVPLASRAGATVEIDGLKAGITPYKTDCPGGYFHKTHTVFGARLEHAMVLKISMEGYASQQITLTNGPYEWIAVTGRHRGNYFLLKSSEFHIDLQRAIYRAASAAETGERSGPQHPAASALLAENKDPDPPVSTVRIDSDPPGAEIYVDYAFVGQTPSMLRLLPGSHRIELRSPGKKEWQRNLELSKNSEVTLHPVLEPSP